MRQKNIYFDKMFFLKTDYESVYVASDGFRFILNDNFPQDQKQLLEAALISRDEATIKAILKENQSKILDDISISS